VYSRCSDAFRLKVTRFAIESSAIRAAAKFGPELGRKLIESTVRGWVKTYKTQIQKVIYLMNESHIKTILIKKSVISIASYSNV